MAAHIKHRKLLGQAIRQYRKQVNLTQEQLGEKAGLNPKYVGEVERAEKNISFDALMRIVGVLKISISNLVSGI